MAAKRPNKSKSANTVQGLPLVLGAPDPDPTPVADGEEIKKEPWQVELENLSNSFNEREKKFSDQIDRLYGLLSNAVAAPAASAAMAPAPAPKTPVLDLTGLPDPSLNPAEYTRGLQDRVQKFASDTVAFNASQTQATQAQQGEAAAVQRRVEALWDKFSNAHPDLAKHEDFVHLAAEKLLREQVALGGNVERYVFSDPDRFITKVAENAKARLTELGWKPEGDEDGAGEEEDGADGRTSVITGQNTFQNSNNGANNPVRSTPLPGVAQDVLAWQRKAGLI